MHRAVTLHIMPLESVTLAVVAAIAGAALGWWPLAAWTQRSMKGERMPPRTVRIAGAVITAIIFGALALRFGLAWVLPALLVFAAASTVLALVDLAEKRLPNAVIFPTLAAVAGLLVMPTWASGDWIALLWAAIGSAAMFAVYFVLALISPSSMGMGDVKLGLVIGLLLGWFGMNTWLLGLLAAFVIGGLVAIVALLLRRVTIRGSIPFGPSMLAGALIAVLIVGP